jgi:hypothetical protein
MRKGNHIFDLSDYLPLRGGNRADLSTRRPEYNLARWLNWFGGRDDGGASRRQSSQWRWGCRLAPISPRAASPRSSQHPRRHPSSRRHPLPRHGRPANPPRRPCRRPTNRPQRRASPSILSASSASTRAMRQTGWANPTSGPMHHRQRFGVTSARTVKSTCISISICKEG